MDDPADTRLPRLAPLLLIGMLVWLAILRPGNLAGPDGSVRFLASTLTAVAAVGYVAWRFHGLIPAVAAVTLLRFADAAEPPAIVRTWDAMVLATLAVGIGVGSRQGRAGWGPWLVLAAVAAGAALFGWFGWQLPSPADPVARVRLQQVTIGLIAATVVAGLLAGGAGWCDRARLIAVAVVIPATGVVGFRLHHGDWPDLLAGGKWGSLFAEWQAAVRDGSWDSGAWSWTTPWVAGPLVLVGLWRTVARGIKGWHRGRPPLAWLITVTAVGALLAVGARPAAADSLVLAAFGAMLSVFGVADLMLALIERIRLESPEPGPVAVPRVT